MQILVDKMPEYPSECLFEEYNFYTGENICRIDKCNCCPSDCKYLKEVNNESTSKNNA